MCKDEQQEGILKMATEVNILFDKPLYEIQETQLDHIPRIGETILRVCDKSDIAKVITCWRVDTITHHVKNNKISIYVKKVNHEVGTANYSDLTEFGAWLKIFFKRHMVGIDDWLLVSLVERAACNELSKDVIGNWIENSSELLDKKLIDFELYCRLKI